MRLALIVENPKWEPFTTVSDKFKSLAGKSVLVVRGRCKEKGHESPDRKFIKQEPDSPEALAADMRKLGKSPDAIEKAVAAFKPKAKKSASVLAIALALLGLATSAFGQADITSFLPTAQLAATSTNTPGAGILGWDIDDVAVFQLTSTTTNGRSALTASNIVIYLDTAHAGSTLQTNAYTLTFLSATNASTITSFARITNTIGGSFLRVGNTCNANTNHVLVNGFYWRVRHY